MKKLAILSLAAILSISCNAQENKKVKKIQNDKDNLSQTTVQPKGTWKVDKEFDENGNLIRYDSIYSWSSGDNLDELADLNRDSILQSMESKFYRNFSQFDKLGYDDIFSSDSLFTHRFFDDDFFTSEFGEDFMDIDKMHKRMELIQKKFLEKYRSDFKQPEDSSSKDNK